MKKLLFSLFLLFSLSVFSQPPDAEACSRRARRVYEGALYHYQLREYDRALTEIRRCVEMDPDCQAAWFLKAEVLGSLRRFDGAAMAWEKAIQMDPESWPEAYYFLAYVFYRSGAYATAESLFKHYINSQPEGAAMQQQAVRYLEAARFGIDAMANPVEFRPENLGHGVNSAFAEYSPVLTADGQTLVFTRRSPAEASHSGQGPDVENFYISHHDGYRWGTAVPLGPPVNTPLNEGAPSITANGRELFYTACNRPGGFGSCDIYYSVRRGDTWSQPLNLGRGINTAAWESQPGISADGRELYFVSNRPGGLGETDIWMSRRDESGRWGSPVNLGETINTPGREMSPFIHPDGETLYFASDGHPGMGGLDLFVSRRDSLGNWQKPVNIGYPVNTHADEFGLSVSADGTRAFFASDITGGYGDLDIYSFAMPPLHRPQLLTWMRGLVRDSISGNPLGARIQLYSVLDGETILETCADSVQGDFLVALPVDEPLGLHVSMPGYLFFSDHFSFDNRRTAPDPLIRYIRLQPIRKGQAVVMRNVFFDTDSYYLRSESRAELDNLLSLLLENPEMQIEIGGHTDNTGRFEYNLSLSENRARAVVDYLTERGVDRNRLSYRGYADTRPVATNETEEGRAQNRRTEFRVQ